MDIYEMPYDLAVSVVCMDEKPYQQLLDEAREPLPMSLGDTQKIDFEYVRKGTCSIFMFVELLGGVRHVSVREHCAAVDRVEEIKHLADISYPDKQKIIFVMDNLNTHAIAPPYKAYPAQETRLIAIKLELHYTPKHRGWLDMAEVEFNVLTRQCLIRRIADINEFWNKLEAWETDRNHADSNICGHFTTGNVREKLVSLYSKFAAPIPE